MECLQFLLFGFNVVFWAIGATMLGLGIWMAVDPGAFEAMDLAAGAGMDDAVWSAVVYTFIAIGALLFLVGFFGCVGAARADRGSIFLFLYVISVGVIIILEIVVVILTAVYWNAIGIEVADSMRNDVRTKYNNETSTDGLSTSWNNMQQQWQCCGSYNYTDYFLSNYDNRTGPEIRVPYTCCKETENVDKTACQRGSQEYIYEQGCYYALIDWLDQNAPIIIGVTCGFAVLQLAGLFIASCLINSKNRKKGSAA